MQRADRRIEHSELQQREKERIAQQRTAGKGNSEIAAAEEWREGEGKQCMDTNGR